jgi:putative transposase
LASAAAGSRFVCAIVFFDCLHIKSATKGAVKSKAMYLAIGVRCSGRRQVLASNRLKAASSRLRVMTEFRNRAPMTC